MPSNRFGQIFTFTTWGESHGKAIGVVIDGCPAGIEVSEDQIALFTNFRRPGQRIGTSMRSEKDHPHIFSGVFEGKTTGAPISIIFFNEDARESNYEPIKDLYRPGHANFTYLAKYGVFDYRGGGRASARETLARVAAGAIAHLFLKIHEIELCGYVKKIGTIEARSPSLNLTEGLKTRIKEDVLFCPDPLVRPQMQGLLSKAAEDGESLGGVVELITSPLPVGLGEPVYEKIQACIAKAMMTIPACKGVFFGNQLEDLELYGSCYQDSFGLTTHDEVVTTSNRCGGSLGGLTTGAPLCFQVHFKPTSSVKKDLKTVSLEKKESIFRIPEGSRHDPCVVIRATPVVEAMTALVLADLILQNRSSRVKSSCLEKLKINTF